jgi:hypothetical protein
MSTQRPQRKMLSAELTAVLVLLGLSVFINYIDRGNLSIAAPLLQGRTPYLLDSAGLAAFGLLLDLCLSASPGRMARGSLQG